MTAAQNSAATAVATAVYWKADDGGVEYEYVRALNLERRSYDVPQGHEELRDLITSLGGTPHAVGVKRPTGGRWTEQVTDRDATYGPPPLVVELTRDELADLAATRMPRAVYTRITRALAAGIQPREWGEWQENDLPRQCRVSGRGRHGAKATAQTPKVTVVELDPITRPNGQDYYPRSLNGRWDVEVVREAHAAGVSVLFYGAPGTGKTACLEAAFVDSDGNAAWEYVAGTSDTEAADFVGTYVPEPGGGARWMDGPLVRAMERGVPLIIDEVALIDSRALAIVYAAMDGRGMVTVTSNPARGDVYAQPGFGVHSACNPDAPGAQMSEALLSRHLLQVEYGTDYDLLERFCPKPIVTVARNLEKRRANGELTWSPQARELFGYAKLAKLFDESLAQRNLIASAPEMDRPLVADVLSTTIGTPVTTLTTGRDS